MPFTPSHAAIALPFIRSRCFSATALIIGSMAPDFEYFFTMNDVGVYGHTFAGIFYFDLPVTLFFAFVFHRIVKENLINNLPYFAQRKFAELKQFQFTRYVQPHWLVFTLSAVLGTVSHLFWDSFTHPETWAVKSFAIYDTIVPFQGARYPFYYFLQYVSSYSGLFILTVYFLFMKQNGEVEIRRPAFLYWISVILIVCLILFLRFYWSSDPFNLVLGLISTITALGIALIIAGFIPFSNPIVKPNY